MAPRKAAADDTAIRLEAKVKEEDVARDDLSRDDGVVISVNEKRLLRKIDMIMMPMLAFSYLLQYMDKASLSNASVMGIIEDLHLHGQQYLWLGGVFYFGYLVASYPVSVLLVRFPLGKTLAASVIIWGIVLACHAAASSFSSIMVVRILLGVFESTIGPGFTLITSIWYKPSEHASRHGLWFAGNSLGAIVGALIAFGCAHITSGTLVAWRVLFLILGSMTVLWGAVLMWKLPDTPSRAKFLNTEDRLAAHQRVQVRQHTTKTNHWSRKQFLEALRDPQIWFLFVLQSTGALTNGVVSNFTSIILRSFGFITLDTLLLNMPVFAFQFVIVIGSTFLAQRLRKSRIWICIVGNVISIIGCVLIRQLPFSNLGGRYVGAIMLVGYTNNFPLVLSLISSNVGGLTKRATANATFFVAYCAGNIAGPQLFITSEKPKYQTAFTSMIAITAFDVLVLFFYRFYLDFMNKKRDREQGVSIDPEADMVTASAEHAGLAAELDETDWEVPSYRYHI